MLDGAAPDFLSFPDFLKARPFEDGGARFVYVEASKEARDFQGEKILGKALAASAQYFQQYGNIDMDHLSILGARRGVANPYLYEIGHPVEVKADGAHTFVKASIFQGDTPVAAHANAFWDSLTKLNPPKRWYPSVGGKVVNRTVDVDPVTKEPISVVTDVIWSNIGFSLTPVNPAVPGVSTMPLGTLAKSFSSVAGSDSSIRWHFAKSDGLCATPTSSDMASLEGGAALQKQSLDRKIQATIPDFWSFREALSGDLKAGRCKGAARDIVEHAHAHYGLDRSHATDWTERFLHGLSADLSKKVHCK